MRKVYQSNRKSGQAIIFLMAVMVIGLFALIWNFDLHRVISAKIKVRNSGDSAALAGARWQGYALNMIGELNLMQAALISANMLSAADAVPPEVDELVLLRTRLDYLGPLAAFSVAQQAAFNNGAFHDEELAKDLREVADDIEGQIGYINEPYIGAFFEYADLLRNIANNGVAVGSYSLNLDGGHPLENVSFYAAIAAANSGWWCWFYETGILEYYTDYTSWPSGVKNYTGDTDFFNLKLGSFTNNIEGIIYYPPPSVIFNNNYQSDLVGYIGTNEVFINAGGDSSNLDSIYLYATNVSWQIYGANWSKKWPPAYGIDGEVGANAFPFRANVRDEYNYLGAEAGVGVEGAIEKGIISKREDETLDIEYKTKAKTFGYLPVDPQDTTLKAIYPDGKVPPNYFGFVFPAFDRVQLIHSDIGDKLISPTFYKHVKYHLHPYLQDGTNALHMDCSYCELLLIWESLDKEAGIKWLENSYRNGADDASNPCYVEPWSRGGGGGGGGGASGGT